MAQMMVDELVIGGISGLQDPFPVATELLVWPERAVEPSFNEYMADSIREIRQLQNLADETINNLVDGEVSSVSEAAIAIEKANTAFMTLLQVRNKIISAYGQIQGVQA